MYLYLGARLQFHPIGVGSALVTGLAGIAGALCFLYAAKTSNVSTVVTITALYPAVTIVLAYLFLGEEISTKQLIGMLMAGGAIYFLSS